DAIYLNGPPDLHRLDLAFLFLPANERDHVVHHLRPVPEGLARPGDGLVRADEYLFDAELPQGMEGRNVALYGAVGLDRNEAALHAEAPLLDGDDVQVMRVDLGKEHGHIRG